MQGYSSRGNWGWFPLSWTCFHELNWNSAFLGGGEGRGVEHFSIPPSSLSRKNILSTIINNHLNMYFVNPFPMELEYTKYYLSSDSFSYIVSTHFLHLEHENSYLITWWAFLLSNLSLIKYKLTYCVEKDLHKFFT